jgi:hydrogenase maturation factor
VRPEKAQEIQRALERKRIKSAIIGRITDTKNGRWVKTEGKKQPLEKPSSDPYWKAYWRAIRERWK